MENDPYPAPDERLRFEAFEFSLRRRELRREGRLVEIGQRGQDLLATLLADAGRPVSKGQLMRAAWGDRTVEDSNLTVQIAKLRRHLGSRRDDPAEAGPFIRTVPGFGYVFEEPVTRQKGSAVEPQQPGAALHTRLAPGQDWLAEPLTPFIGRDRERRALAQLFPDSRLVTLTGMGGVGKTRLAMRLSHEIGTAYPDGVRVVDLAPLAEAHQVDEAVAAAVGAGGGELAAALAIIGALRGRHLLLLLDNAEHLALPVARLLARVLPACPLLSVLVTSRDVLGMPGEIVFRLSPLDLPPERDALTAAEALGFDAVRLLADRARAMLPGFAIDDANAPDAAAICRRLDGIALAIEMAVPRLQVLTVRQLAERLQDRFGTVAHLRHGVPPRQRTLQAMFDWSWELLSPRERRLLQLLALSPAGTTLDTLEALAAADAPSDAAAPPDVLERLTRLAQSSLVVVGVPGPGQTSGLRYRLLETTRQYALDHLDPGQLSELSRMHGLSMAALFERAEAEWPETCSATWLERYGPDADNLRAAMQWAFGAPEQSELALRLVAAGFSLWWELPGLPLREAGGWYARALAGVGPHTPPGVEARLWLGQSWTDTVDNDVENFPAADRAARLFRAAGDAVGLGAALWRAASTVLFRDHDPAAAALLQGAAQVLANRPAAKWRALCHVREADLLQAGGAMLPALAKYDEALSKMQQLGYGYGLMVCGGNRSYLLFELGRLEDAIDALRDLQEDLPPGLRLPLLSLLATMLAAAGRDAEARAVVRNALEGTAAIGMSATLARSIETLALILARSGDCGTAATLLGFVLERHPADRVRLGPRRVVLERLQALLDTGLAPAERRRWLAEGSGLTEDQAVAAAIGAAEQA